MAEVRVIPQKWIDESWREAMAYVWGDFLPPPKGYLTDADRLDVEALIALRDQPEPEDDPA